MNKLEMAHDWYLKHAGGADIHMALEVSLAWQYADAMQAEADKREDKSIPDVFKKDKDGNCLHTHTTFGGGECFDCGVNLEGEWQPDWSQAPDWANWWAIDGFGDKKANWYRDKPYLDDDSLIEDEWNIDLDSQRDSFVKAQSFGYNGHWKDSLRKRPE